MIVAPGWPVAENYSALVLLDNLYIRINQTPLITPPSKGY